MSSHTHTHWFLVVEYARYHSIFNPTVWTPCWIDALSTVSVFCSLWLVWWHLARNESSGSFCNIQQLLKGWYGLQFPYNWLLWLGASPSLTVIGSAVVAVVICIIALFTRTERKNGTLTSLHLRTIRMLYVQKCF